MAEFRPWPPTHFSWSQIRMARTCLEQYRRRYILGEKARPNVRLLWGVADHAGIAHDLELRIAGDGAPRDDVLTVASERWDLEVESAGGHEEVEWDREAEGLRGNDLKKWAGGQRERMLSLTGLYHSAVCPTIRPVAVEESFTVEIPGIATPLLGVIDIAEEGLIRDRKTSARMPSERSADWAMQGRIYQLHRPVPMVWDLSVKTKQPQVSPRLFPMEASDAIRQLTQKQIAATVKQIQWCMDEFGPEHPWPDGMLSQSYFKSACSWCGWGPNAENTCFWWKGE